MRTPTILLSIVALVAVACGGESGDTTTSLDEATTTSSVVEATTTTAEQATTTAPTTAPPTSEPATGGAGGDECLVGTWVLDDDVFVDNFGPIFAEQGMADAEVSALGGTFTVEMAADGTFVASRDGWGFSIQSQQGNVILEIDGDETGTWSAEGSTLTITSVESDVAVAASVEIDGEVVELPQGQFPVETPPGIASNSEFECSGDTLTLSNDGVTSVLNRS